VRYVDRVKRQAPFVILTYHYRLLPTKQQHRALEAILESQRQLYNAALEERIDAYRKASV
jgi:putative transposase